MIRLPRRASRLILAALLALLACPDAGAGRQVVFSLDTPAVASGVAPREKAPGGDEGTVKPTGSAGVANAGGAKWDEKSARLAVRGWLAANPRAKGLSAAERERIERRHAKRLVAGRAHAVEMRAELAKLPLPEAGELPARAADARERAGESKAERPERAKARPAETRDRPRAAEERRRSEEPAGGRPAPFPYDPARLPGEPEGDRLAVPGPPDERNVTIMSPDFPRWLDRALRQREAEGKLPLDWSVFPKIRNRYGRRVTPRMFVMAVLLIESRGIQRKGGRLFEAGGFAGFMQLGRSYPKQVRGDGRENLAAGVRHLYPAFHKVFVKDAALRRDEPTVDKLLMVGACYNRGNYSRASKMRWKELVERTRPVPLERRRYTGLHDNRIAVFYGLQLKGFLGFPFTAAEKRWLRAFRSFNDVGPWAEKKYAQLRNALLGRSKVTGR